MVSLMFMKWVSTSFEPEDLTFYIYLKRTDLDKAWARHQNRRNCRRFYEAGYADQHAQWLGATYRKATQHMGST